MTFIDYLLIAVAWVVFLFTIRGAVLFFRSLKRRRRF